MSERAQWVPLASLARGRTFRLVPPGPDYRLLGVHVDGEAECVRLSDGAKVLVRIKGRQVLPGHAAPGAGGGE